jgi:hypothetical protein
VNSLVSLLYPIPSVIPSSYEKVFALLAACQKYDMASIQSHIRAEVIRGTFPSPVGIEAFRAYAITNNLGLIPEMESAARVTLSYPMTFESLGEVLQSFTGRALCDLVRYRKRCRDNVVSCLDSFLGVRSRSEIWEGCNHRHGSDPNNARWPHNFFTSKSDELKKSFIRAVFSPSNILEEYLEAFKNDRSTNCNSCFRAHAAEGAAFCRELQDELAQALDKVNSLFLFGFLTRLILTARVTSILSDRRQPRLPLATRPPTRYPCRLMLSALSSARSKGFVASAVMYLRCDLVARRIERKGRV